MRSGRNTDGEARRVKIVTRDTFGVKRIGATDPWERTDCYLTRKLESKLTNKIT